MFHQLILATHNANKLNEARQILAPLGIEVIGANDLNLPDVDETGATFHENALLKAQAVFKATGKPVLADDSGLCIPALDGAPGVFSARFAAAHGGYPAVFSYLNELLTGKSRAAYFICSMVLVLSENQMVSFEGRVDGHLNLKPSGTHTFGYDPIFVPAGYTDTFGVLEADVKNKISHRARAMAQLVSFLQKADFK